MQLSRDDFAAWLARYIAAWRSDDPDTIGELFSDDVAYSFYGGKSYVVGRDAVVQRWLEKADDNAWEAHYEPLAIDVEVHVAIGWTRYFAEDGTMREEYSNIFVCRFDQAGRCAHFTEWWAQTGPEGEE
jgi:hypothetical protein